MSFLLNFGSLLTILFYHQQPTLSTYFFKVVLLLNTQSSLFFNNLYAVFLPMLRISHKSLIFITSLYSSNKYITSILVHKLNILTLFQCTISLYVQKTLKYLSYTNGNLQNCSIGFSPSRRCPDCPRCLHTRP